MDWQDEETDYFDVDNFSWNESNLLTRTKSEVSLAGVLDRSVSSKEVQVSFVNCKESKSFLSAFEQLDLEVNSRDSADLFKRSCDVQTDTPPLETGDMVPCFQTREIPSYRLVLQGPEILQFQGKQYEPKDIAPFWKKDSRMWLWKSKHREDDRETMDKTKQDEHPFSMPFSTSDEDLKRFQ